MSERKPKSQGAKKSLDKCKQAHRMTSEELRNFAQRVGLDNYPPTPPNRRSDSLPRPEAKTKKGKKNVKAEAKAKKGKKSRKANRKANDMSAELLARVRRVADMLDPPIPVISPDWWRVDDMVAFPPISSNSNSNSNPNNSNPEVIRANEVPPLIPGDFRDSDTSDDEDVPGPELDGKENEEEGLLSTFIEEENYSDQPQTVYGAYFNSSTAEKEKEEEQQRQKEQQRQQKAWERREARREEREKRRAAEDNPQEAQEEPGNIHHEDDEDEDYEEEEEEEDQKDQDQDHFPVPLAIHKQYADMPAIFVSQMALASQAFPEFANPPSARRGFLSSIVRFFRTVRQRGGIATSNNIITDEGNDDEEDEDDGKKEEEEEEEEEYDEDFDEVYIDDFDNDDDGNDANTTHEEEEERMPGIFTELHQSTELSYRAMRERVMKQHGISYVAFNERVRTYRHFLNYLRDLPDAQRVVQGLTIELASIDELLVQEELEKFVFEQMERAIVRRKKRDAIRKGNLKEEEEEEEEEENESTTSSLELEDKSLERKQKKRKRRRNRNRERELSSVSSSSSFEGKVKEEEGEGEEGEEEEREEMDPLLTHSQFPVVLDRLQQYRSNTLAGQDSIITDRGIGALYDRQERRDRLSRRRMLMQLQDHASDRSLNSTKTDETNETNGTNGTNGTSSSSASSSMSSSMFKKTSWWLYKDTYKLFKKMRDPQLTYEGFIKRMGKK